jgi:hypothetical protein
VRVLVGDGRGGLLRPRRYLAGKQLGSIAVADFDRDGKTDLAVSAAGRSVTGKRAIRLLLGDGMGRYLPAGRFAIDRQAYGDIAAADINRDKRPELIASNGFTNGVSALLNTTRRRASPSARLRPSRRPARPLRGSPHSRENEFELSGVAGVLARNAHLSVLEDPKPERAAVAGGENASRPPS